MNNKELLELFSINEENKEVENKKIKNKNIFDVFKKIVYNKNLDGSDFKILTRHMLLKWLSNDKRLIKLTNDLNSFDIPIDIMVETIKYELKKRNIKFIKWISNKNQNIFDKTSRELIMKEYNLNYDKYIEIEQLITKKHVKYLKNKYNI